MRNRYWRIAAILAATSLIAAACGGADDDTTDDSTDDSTEEADDTTEEATDDADSGVSGEVRLDGSSTVGPLSEVAAELYMDQNPDVIVTVNISGTGGGFERFCNGESDGNNSSRPIKDDEAANCEEAGIAYDFVTVANDALAALVNADFPVDCMTVDQVSQIWDADSDVDVWGDVDGLDLPDDFASEPAQLYGPGTDSGTFDYWTEAINGESGVIRNDYIDIGEDDNAAVTAIQSDVYATGYVPFSYFQEAGDAVKALEIDNGDGCVAATPENVANETYAPLGRGLFVYFSDTALARPEVVDFANFYIENAKEIADLAGFVPLTDEQIETARERVANLAG